MNHYRRQFLLSATPAAVYHALATQQGLRSWWTETCDAATTTVGGKITFRFGPHHKVMQIENLAPGRELRWLCVEAYLDLPQLQRKNEWVGTQIVFKLTPEEGGKTRLDFEHIGLTPEFECFDICRGGWDQYLGSLQSLVETGQGAPFQTHQAGCAGLNVA